jgi:hypothetical protein
MSQDASPAARTRISDAGTIGDESDFLWHLRAPFSDMQESTVCHRAKRKSTIGMKGVNQRQPACHGCTNPSIERWRCGRQRIGLEQLAATSRAATAAGEGPSGQSFVRRDERTGESSNDSIKVCDRRI